MPVAFHDPSSNASPSQSAIILSSAFSMLNSRLALQVAKQPTQARPASCRLQLCTDGCWQLIGGRHMANKSGSGATACQLLCKHAVYLSDSSVMCSRCSMTSSSKRRFREVTCMKNHQAQQQQASSPSKVCYQQGRTASCKTNCTDISGLKKDLRVSSGLAYSTDAKHLYIELLAVRAHSCNSPHPA